MRKKSCKMKPAPDEGKPRLGIRVQLIFLVLLFLIISTCTIWNTSNLDRAISRRTKSYVKDVAIQLAGDINNQLEHHWQDLELLKDSLAHIDDMENVDERRRYLDDRAQFLGFDSLMLLSADGTVTDPANSHGNVWELSGIAASFQGKNGVSLMNQQSILYSVPLFQEDRVAGVLAGVRNKENMQALIQPKSFDGLGLTCIADIEGNVVISPTDLDPFLRLDNIIAEFTDQETIQEIGKMQENMANHQDGVLSFTAVDGSELILSYNLLRSYNWVLLTLVPADLISHDTDRYIFQSNLTIYGTFLIIALFFAALFYSYRIHRKRVEAIVFKDPVTSGINNAAFQIRCRELVWNAPSLTYTMVSLNIKNFKLINEYFGSTAGDQTLQHIAKVLEQHVGKNELAARGEADHFFLLLNEVEENVLQERLQKITAHINAFNETRAEPYYLTILMGAYLIEDPTQDITVMQDRASTACRSQYDFPNHLCVFYHNSFTEQLHREQKLNNLFDDSLANRDFQVYLQPKVWQSNGVVGGAEALVRWQHPQEGVIFPSDFIPVFEKSGQICRLDLFVFEEACRLLSGWIQAGQPCFPISVNLSRQHFKTPDFLQQLASIKTHYQIPDDLLELELTESLFFDDQMIDIVKDNIHQMHQLGFLCSLDDFGSGFSSLGLLKEFDVDTIKLDRRFFLDIHKKKAQEVASCLFELAKRLGIQTVAEGIETPEQLSFVKQAGCDLVQGYFYTKPLPVKEFEAWLTGYRQRRAEL